MNRSEKRRVKRNVMALMEHAEEKIRVLGKERGALWIEAHETKHALAGAEFNLRKLQDTNARLIAALTNISQNAPHIYVLSGETSHHAAHCPPCIANAALNPVGEINPPKEPT